MADKPVYVYESATAVVRIHPSERTAEEQRKTLEKALLDFYHAVQKNPKSRGVW